ncbi:RING-H2 finger protein ATL16-like [Cornus florida]|uniref:RING-H2 finger protein ATL16-like n=1 Tax=Cornus florida TaxID=4283 RepID=UPI002899BFA5|nr:RING-H2 finger protein ATL16-like [Cornus florida]
MDLLINKHLLYIHGSQALSSIKTPPPNSTLHPPNNTSFPIIAIAIIGILATAFLLVSYYVFVIKCCLNWQRLDLLRRFSFSRNRPREDPLMAYSPATENRGLDESVIRSIPIFQFKSGEKEQTTECAVCLNDFQVDEKLRIIPNCSHFFHIDCIDVWLQSNANCPLCRTSISTTPPQFPFDHQAIVVNSFPQDPNPYTDDFIGRDEDFVVIELGEQDNADQSLLRMQERFSSRGPIPIGPFPVKLEQKMAQKKAKKINFVSSMGDEWIDNREQDEQFAIQPIRRSFSMDSAADRQIYLAVQEFVQQNRHDNEVSSSEDCSSRVRRSFFSFGYGRGSRNSILPTQLEP